MPTMHVNRTTGESLPDNPSRVSVGNCIEILFACAAAADAFSKSYAHKDPSHTEKAFSQLACLLLSRRDGNSIRQDARTLGSMLGCEIVDLFTQPPAGEVH